MNSEERNAYPNREKYTGLPADDPLLSDPDVRRFHDEVVARVNFMEEMEQAMGGHAR